MTDEIVHSQEPVVIFGGGSAVNDVISYAMSLASTVVAADGGASLALENGFKPAAIVGDFDSIGSELLSVLDPETLHHIPEQETTDFDKSLRNVAAPLVLAVGFAGKRLDHTLAALNTLVAHPDRRCVIVGEDDITFLAPPEIELDLPVGSVFSLFPMGHVQGKSTGLKWPIDGISFAPDQRVGTSNEVSGPVRLSVDAPVMLVIVPVAHLESVTQQLSNCAARWSARGV